MIVKRILLSAAAAATVFGATPASAQFFFQPPKLKGDVVRGDELGLGMALSGATEAEQRAALVWSLRAALNVAALQCQFEPILLTVQNYNSVLTDHSVELKSSYDVLGKYFARNAKTKKAGQDALDKFGTRIYSSFSAVSSQYTFCQTAGDIGADAVFAPRGGFGGVAQRRMRELRNSLMLSGEQRFPGRVAPLVGDPHRPRGDKECWKGKVYQSDKCGAL